ncbi:flavin reductase family protein [Saccharothrix obliqua]|uniref:flavin reductase family protein n=1 Tax=Saccharothrix obliqua TaxID=2861747 RepID=UPI001C5ED129|nr:flavin reductase family protein [Saccharothrix obliqua]MBW4721598.1 flavin reductase family protein [Saccharothrix obliqua]
MSSPVIPTPNISAPFDEKEFRTVLGRFATGVVAVTALDAGDSQPAGLAVNSFTSVSLDPPLVLFCIAHTSSSWPKVRAAERFCVNILGEAQRETSERFATSGSDRFRGLRWTGTPQGAPILEGAIGWLECSVEAEHPTGDHVVVIARVHHVGAHHVGAPLVFYRGSYGRLAAA